MRNSHLKIIIFLLLDTLISVVWGQTPIPPSSGALPVVITGSRFAYPLLQNWIEEYHQLNPGVQITIEPRGARDPLHYDILAEAFDQEESVAKRRDYAFIARYAILPVANSKSLFSKYYGVTGVDAQLMRQLFFHDIYVEKEKEREVKFSYLIYSRLQRAGSPTVFAHYFGYTQKDIRGRAVAGSDEQLLKALLRDSLAVSYLPLTLLYNLASGLPVDGVTILPVDLNGDGSIMPNEKIYANRASVTQYLNDKDQKDVDNIPIGYLHLSVDKTEVRPEVLNFVSWVIANGAKDLATFGFLSPGKERENSQIFSNRNDQ